MTAVVYTDASHSLKAKTAACGFVVLVDNKIVKHAVTLVGNCLISGDAEMFSIVQALQYCFLLNGVLKIIVHTDYETAVKFKGKSKRSRRFPFSQELKYTINIIRDHGIILEFNKVKAHADDKYNNLIDQSSRAELRKYLKSNAQTLKPEAPRGHKID